MIKDNIVVCKSQITEDTKVLTKIYKAKKVQYDLLSVDHNIVEKYIELGWETFSKPLKTKTKIRKTKNYFKQFVDDVWCQLYELGYRKLNSEDTCFIESDDLERFNFDILAINEDSVLIIDCLANEELGKSLEVEGRFINFSIKLEKIRKSIQSLYGKNLRVKYIFATRNVRTDIDQPYFKEFISSNSFYYNDKTYNYINELIKNYKNAALYQFLGLLFKNEIISKQKIEIPAVRGEMGGRNYYMFSIEPKTLLKMGFVLHRTKANESELPTYQRLLVPTRLPGITKFIDEGGYFPNSIILNFNTKKHKIQFEQNSKLEGSNSCFGTLKIPNSYAIAYIIDGQHRVYGYANSKYQSVNTIPVVAFENLETSDQLKIFMDINENQKAVSPSLKLDLEEDLYWEADRADSRIKALRSSIVKELANNMNSPLYEKISVGEDKSLLTFKPFYTALTSSSFLPKAKGNVYSEDSRKYSLYNLDEISNNKAMMDCRSRVVKIIFQIYNLVEEEFNSLFLEDKSFIISNRGTYAFISTADSLNKYLVDKGRITSTSSDVERFEAMRPYLHTLLSFLQNDIEEEDKKNQLSLLGSGADKKWLRYFQNIIHKEHKDFLPLELIDYLERQDEELQDKGRAMGIEIEKKIKSLVLEKIQYLFGSNWELEINTIKRECLNRAEQEKEKHYKDGLGSRDIQWTEMFNINDYKTIIEKYWSKKPEVGSEFITFDKQFTIDMGDGINSKSKALKWLSYFNSYRNLWAHEGTKEKRLNKEEVRNIEKIFNHFSNILLKS
ncbi:DGQHR domain-containing protein [Myroides guanonis]|uniref:DNA sulfur modification protein DndB n=1 Tax=Myroides guanonis TaxID=1150112 RepID=A0A1I3PNF9_9FLAO|nr:DGQHR domain-containing protein [Myroides guanonis]SFJ23042.1 DNA sulfur modification protein DndB [Myroides guanonis]